MSSLFRTLCQPPMYPLTDLARDQQKRDALEKKLKALQDDHDAVKKSQRYALLANMQLKAKVRQIERD